MQAVILAAGRGSRMNSLTADVPKPLLRVAGKTLLEHKFDVLPPEVDEVIIVVGYLRGAIEEAFGDTYKNLRIRYVVQDVLDGTAGALWRAKDMLKDRFVVMMGDDLYGKEDTERAINMKDWSLVVNETAHMSAGGRIVTDERGGILAIEEGEHHGIPGLVSTNLFCLDTRLFDHELIPKSEGSSEYGLPQTVLAASKKSNIPFAAIISTFWIQITSPEDLAAAEAFLAHK